jgi:hypothetical protein
VVIADEQTAGRGRRGRTWFASPGDSPSFSLLWRFAPGTAPAGLSLAVGVAVARALQRVGAGETALKWPNDLLKDGGNSRLKYGLFDGSGWRMQGALDYAAFDTLIAELPTRPTRIVACNRMKQGT